MNLNPRFLIKAKSLNTNFTIISNMSNKITMKVDENVFYELIKLKGRLKTKTWDELFRKIIKKYRK